MPVVNLDELKIGQTILFKSISDYDNVQRKGTIIGLGSYPMVKHYDLLPIYQEIRKTHPSMAPIEKLNFIVFKLFENNVNTNDFVYAKEWMEISSVEIVEENKQVKIIVYNIDNITAMNVLDLLKSNNYLCKLEQ